MTRLMLERMIVVMLLVAVVTAPNIFGQDARTPAGGRPGDELLPIEQNGVWGYASRDGKVIIKPQFTRAARFSEGLALVWAGGVTLTDPVVKSFVKMGYIDQTGHWVIHSRFQYFFFDDFSDGLVPFRQQFSKWGYMDRTGKIAIRPRFDWAGDFSENVAAVQLDGKCAHVDRTGKIIDQPQTILSRHKPEQDRRGTYFVKPQSPPCS